MEQAGTDMRTVDAFSWRCKPSSDSSDVLNFQPSILRLSEERRLVLVQASNGCVCSVQTQHADRLSSVLCYWVQPVSQAAMCPLTTMIWTCKRLQNKRPGSQLTCS